MESAGSLPHSQVSVTCPYPEPAQSRLYPTLYFLKIHLNIILLSTTGTTKWPPSFMFPRQNPVYATPFRHTRYMPHPSHSRFDHPKIIGWGVQVIQLLIM